MERCNTWLDRDELLPWQRVLAQKAPRESEEMQNSRASRGKAQTTDQREETELREAASAPRKLKTTRKPGKTCKAFEGLYCRGLRSSSTVLALGHPWDKWELGYAPSLVQHIQAPPSSSPSRQPATGGAP